ncbi:MAG TPA: NAD(P)H-hydrate epimerase, partial [Candidatus Babeliales bacterium]|nr:NAD(P)H-hydrate epimerase [Candidatus Babeliales bacterium]
MPIYATAAIRQLEQLANEQYHLTPHVLMQRAGQAALHYLLERFKECKRIAIFCGGGNNGGDGYTLAYLAAQYPLQVTLWQVGNPENLSPAAAAALAQCVSHHIPCQVWQEGAELGQADLLVDAIGGIGFSTVLRPNLVTVIHALQQHGAPILALDLPTGIAADTGVVLGTAIKATATITFIAPKLGLVTGSGPAYTGEWVVNDLQLPADLFTQVSPLANTLAPALATVFAPRARDAYKSNFGHVLIIGGDKGMSGAAYLAASAALRVGAGAVSIATHPEHAAGLTVTCPEIMCHGVNNPQDLAPLLTKATVIVFGPGIGQSPWALHLWQHVSQQTLPLVVDADGLNL